MSTVYDSRRSEFRSPLGAVETGGAVTFTARPESSRFPLRGFLCAAFEPGDKYIELEMEHTASGEDYEEFSITFDAGDTPGLWHYTFRFENEGGFFRYGAPDGHTGGAAKFYGSQYPPAFQLTVYEKYPDEASREWLCDGIVYQVFPDRFARGAAQPRSYPRKSERIMHSDMTEEPFWRPEPFEGKVQMTNRDFFGGDLEGVRGKLDYLASLGVSAIYLNPIFEAFSNHRYDTADYTAIDGELGTIDDFKALCDAAHERGIRIILDGVFNHTGSDSVYFNRRGTYPEAGAFQSRDSKWADWYEFTNYPYDYSSWWGILTLPQTRENEPSYRDFIAGSGKGSIVRRWLDAGADGWRLDVADELPDDFIRTLAASAHLSKRDAPIIGEVWEDASNKISYGVRRNYLLGGALDGVTGYTFRTAVLDFLGGGDAGAFRDALSDILENYPPHTLRCTLNILGTHDTPRVLTALGAPDDFWQGGRDRRAGAVLSPERYAAARALLKLGALMQYSFIGTPCVYYGDEAGMQGAEDPFNRAFYPWGREDRELKWWYTRLGSIRRENSAITRGDFEFIGAEGPVVCWRRRLEGAADIYAAVSRSGGEQILRGLPDGSYTDLISGDIFTVKSGECRLPPMCGVLLRAAL